MKVKLIGHAGAVQKAAGDAFRVMVQDYIMVRSDGFVVVMAIPGTGAKSRKRAALEDADESAQIERDATARRPRPGVKSARVTSQTTAPAWIGMQTTCSAISTLTHITFKLASSFFAVWVTHQNGHTHADLVVST